ncbi:NAD(P)-dependent dehydrogenase, short-chain alcohol dehydrogenase family [Paenibacillus algorifonticola]|uniref:NAD(P)-dependent dehydrogenase, short-chain alcohol dehydrogenase family n=1 Tax=Paenibacillus algorifonticola TaxID=684063 RepID=A0A1I2A629_9BACL|nr:SDR family oxidoreductase [Paenibacillus algorifonticola]SFE39412.1 NAD(P)-dependent dehydrogenase, short-chain alcohol dehydrogenase family [Paenibacillus algorifonticola]
MSTMKLRDKVVFITDADSRSGRALFRLFAEQGAHFILNSMSGGAHIKEELKRARTLGLNVLVTATDLCSSSRLQAMLGQAAPQLGRVDVLIHNNDLMKPTSIEYGEEDLFLDLLHTNAKTAFICTKVVGQQMADAGSGAIIYVSSIHAQKPTGSSFAYSATKGAVSMLAKEAALVLGRSGITVNTIELGPIEGDDERFASELSTLYEDYAYKVPNAVLGSYDDLAQLALFLSSDEARYMNGADIRLDGGFLQHYMDFKMKRPPQLGDQGG